MPCGDHHHGNAEPPRGRDLRIGRSAAGVLGNDEGDALLDQEVVLLRVVERPAIIDEANIRRQDDVAGRVDRASDVMMLRSRGKRRELQPAEAEEDSRRRRAERRGCSLRAVDLDPAISVLALPCGAPDRDERQRQGTAGRDGMARDLIRIRMRRVDHCGDRTIAQPCFQSGNAAEAADARRQRLRLGRGGAAGERERRREAGVAVQQTRQLRSFGRAAENENAHAGQGPS